MAIRPVTKKASTKENSRGNISKKQAPQSNSMDGILVSYGVSFTKEERRYIRYGSDKKKSEELKKKIKTCTVPEFLAIDPQNLTDDEQKIQEALRKVYEINGK